MTANCKKSLRFSPNLGKEKHWKWIGRIESHPHTSVAPRLSPLRKTIPHGDITPFLSPANKNAPAQLLFSIVDAAGRNSGNAGPNSSTAFIMSSAFTGLCRSFVQTRTLSSLDMLRRSFHGRHDRQNHTRHRVTLLRKAEAPPKHVKVGQTEP